MYRDRKTNDIFILVEDPYLYKNSYALLKAEPNKLLTNPNNDGILKIDQKIEF
jgi:hypothetical protein